MNLPTRARNKYNNTMDQIFADARRYNERNDFVRYMEANTHLTLEEAYSTFQALKNMPY